LQQKHLRQKVVLDLGNNKTEISIVNLIASMILAESQDLYEIVIEIKRKIIQGN